MESKKNEHDKLEAMHIYEIWNQDLDQFLEVLDDYEK